MKTLDKKIDFACVIKIKNANPNGDPLNGNRPRTNYDGLGEMSEVCIRRKIRDRLQEDGHPIFVQSEDKKTDDATCLRDRANKTLGEKLSGNDLAVIACKTWLDVRAFGQLFALKAPKNDTPDEDTGVSVGIRGPVSIRLAESIDPIDIVSMQITKSVNGVEPKAGKLKSPDTMGMKHFISSGIYVFYGSMNPQLAIKTQFSNEDALAIKKVLPKLFENDCSSSRPEGSMEVLNVIWWVQNGGGKYSSAKVHRSLKVASDGSLNFENLEGLKPEIIEGF